MPDQYIDQTYASAHLGEEYLLAVTEIPGGDLAQLIESATALVQGYLRNSGYATPSTTSDELVKLAVCGAFRIMLASLPEKSIPLPDDWQVHPAYVAYTGLLSGDAQPSGHTLDKSAAVGGWKASEHRSTITNSRPQRASRSNLEDY